MRRLMALATMQCAALAALTAPAVVTVALLIGRMVGHDDAPRVLAIVDAAAAFAAALSVPLCGWCADRTVSRFGRRRPWLIGGALLGVAGSMSMSVATGPITLALAWMFTQAAYNAVFAAINGLVAEGLAPEARMRASGVLSAASFLGAMPGIAAAALFADDVRTMLTVVPLASAALIIPLALKINDTPTERTGRRHASTLALRETVTRPFVGVLGMRFMLSAELAAGLAFALYLFSKRWALDEAEAVRAVSFSSLLGATGVVMGSLMTAFSRRRAMSASSALILALSLLLVGMLGRGLAPDVAIFHLATLLGGVGIGLGLSANKARALTLLPGDHAGFGLGLVSAMGSMAGILAPLVASTLLGAGGYLQFVGDAYAGMYLLLSIPPALVLVVHATGTRRVQFSANASSSRSTRTQN